MRILLLGGAGFIGEYLADKLICRKDCEVIVTCKEKPSRTDSKNCCYVKLNLERTSKKLERIINSSDIIVILTQPNSKIIENLISSINPKSHLKKILYLSSVLIYGNSSSNQDEKSTLDPATDYEKGKYEEEKKLSEFIKGKEIKLCIARLANVYGDVKNKGLINYIFLSVLNKKEMIINGKGDSIRDYIFIEDVANFLEFLVFFNQKSRKEIFNICTGKGYSVKKVIKEVEKELGKKIEIINGMPVDEKKKIIGNNKRIADLSGIKLKYGLTKGLNKTYKNYLALSK